MSPTGPLRPGVDKGTNMTTEREIRERVRRTRSGGWMLTLLLVGMLLAFGGILAGAALGHEYGSEADGAALCVVCVLVFLALSVCLRGLFVVNPNEAVVLQLFGRYVGTVHDE